MNRNIIHKGVQKGTILAIYLYQHGFSIFFGPCCRFVPSCSTYASMSIERFGIVKGGWLSLRRLFKCHPFHPGGYDPVPEKTNIFRKEIPARESWKKEVSLR